MNEEEREYLRKIVNASDRESDEGGEYGNRNYGNSQDPAELTLGRL